MSDTPKTLIERLRDPVLMKRWWDQYGLEAANEIERLRNGFSQSIETVKEQHSEIERLRATLATADKLLREAFDPIQDHHDDLGDLAERIVAHVNATKKQDVSTPLRLSRSAGAAGNE